MTTDVHPGAVAVIDPDEDMITAERLTGGDDTGHEHVPLVRRADDVVRLAVGAILLLITALVARIRNLSTFEADVFHLVNDLPGALYGPVVVVMQAGQLGAALAAAALAWLVVRRWRPGIDILIAGPLAWLATKAVKMVVARPRPDELVTGVHLRGVVPTGIGFPSGHAAVITAIVVVVQPYLPRSWRRCSWVLVAAVAFARVYVGAHLPLDVLGGILLGWIVAVVVRLVGGTPSRRPTAASVRSALAFCHVRVDAVRPVGGDARGSTPFLVDRPGERLFVKIVGHDEHSADVLFRLYRLFAYRRVEDVAPFMTAKQAVEHEAYMGLLAAAVGACVPEVVFATAGPDHSGVLVQRAVDGVTLDRLGDVPDELLTALWQQVTRLHAARIAHRDLRCANVLVGTDGRPWLIDFGFAEAAATDRTLALDIAELLVSTAVVVGTTRAIDAVLETVPAPAIRDALPLLQPLAVSSTSRVAMRRRPGLLGELRQQLADRLGVPAPHPTRMLRLGLQPRVVLSVAAAAFALYALLPTIGGLGQTFTAIRGARIEWLVVLLVASAATYLAAAVEFAGTVRDPLPLGRTTLVQLASSFTGRLAPAGLGRMALAERYLEHAGVSRPEAISALAAQSANGLVVHLGATLVFALAVGRLDVVHIGFPPNLVWYAAVAAAVAAIVIAARRGVSPARMMRPVGAALAAFFAVWRHPTRIAQLVIGGATVTLLYTLAFWAALTAFDAHMGFFEVGLVYLVGGAVANLVPTPGGVGPFEAAAIAGLVAIGTPSGPAVAGVLAFRLATFWLPIPPGGWAFAHLRRVRAV
jgi:undecaprenyl-diphosphatase